VFVLHHFVLDSPTPVPAGHTAHPIGVRKAASGRDYREVVSGARVPGGVVHKLPRDLKLALVANPTALDAWNDITPLARNEFICWVENAKQETTRERRIRRTQEELEEGMRRPCCWPGCDHRERNGK
jgi:hypothetical protein